VRAVKTASTQTKPAVAGCNIFSAIADYNKSIEINPNLAQAYNNRGIARSALGDKEGAIEDFQKAVNLYKEQGNQKLSQDSLNRLKKLRR
jgi:tetratricopeptide (TPR) repeat protein